MLPEGGCSETAKCGHIYRPHTDSETKMVTIELGCKDTMIVHMGPGAGLLQGLGTAWPSSLCMGKRAPRSTRRPSGPSLLPLRQARVATTSGTAVPAGRSLQIK